MKVLDEAALQSVFECELVRDEAAAEWGRYHFSQRCVAEECNEQAAGLWREMSALLTPGANFLGGPLLTSSPLPNVTAPTFSKSFRSMLRLFHSLFSSSLVVFTCSGSPMLIVMQPAARL